MELEQQGEGPLGASVLGRASTILTDKLYFISLRGHPESDQNYYFWTADIDLVYEPFEADFGPLNMSALVKFCRSCHRNLNAPELENKKLYFYSSHDGHKRANAGFLITAFCVLSLGYSPERAWNLICSSYPPFLPFRDVSVGISTFNCTILNCLQGLSRGRDLGWINWRKFDCSEYDFYEQPQNGDWNWIVPPTSNSSAKGEEPHKRFIALCTPNAISNEAAYGFKSWGPEEYCKVFRDRGITGIIRLCRKTYSRQVFTEAGFRHIDLIYTDGSNPSDNIIMRFFEFIESTPGGIAIHCKAGLGRTGTLIGCYLIKYHHFTAESAITWMRLMRPGCVIGPQQQYLLQVQSRLKKSACQIKKLRPLLIPAGKNAEPENGSGSQKSPVKAMRKGSDGDADTVGDRPAYQTAALFQKSRQMQTEISEILRKSLPISSSSLITSMSSFTTPQRGDNQINDNVTLSVPIKMKTLRQIKSLIYPPSAVRKTVLTVLRVLRYPNVNWGMATHHLGTSEMLIRLKEAPDDVSDHPEDFIGILKKYSSDQKCSPDNVMKASGCSHSLCVWLHEMYSLCVCSVKANSLPNVFSSAATPKSTPRAAAVAQQTAGSSSRLTRPPPSLIFGDIVKPHSA